MSGGERAERPRALLVGIERYSVPRSSIRPGTGQALREISILLQRSGWEVSLLSDSSPRLKEQPTRAALEARIAWLAERPQGLLLLSLQLEGGSLFPLDSDPTYQSGALDIDAILAPLSSETAILIDGALHPKRIARFPCALTACAPGEALSLFGARGPSLFLHALVVSLSERCAAGGAQLGQWLKQATTEFNTIQREEMTALSLGDTGEFQALSRLPLEGKVSEPFPTRGETLDSLEEAALAAQHSPSEKGGPASTPLSEHQHPPLEVARLLGRGRYLLLRLLGEGGIGEVYLAEDREMKLRRALKVLKIPKALTEEQRELLRGRMRQAAQGAQRLNERSLNVVRVFDICLDEETEIPFMVMEFIEGETLGERLTRGPLPLDQAMPISLSLCETLAHAHQLQIIHRDLKPDNVMLTQRGEVTDFVKLLDFDLVKLDRAEVQTAEGQVLGTLEYMAPEQLKGYEIDARADVFALGAILFEIFTGERLNTPGNQQQIMRRLLDEGFPASLDRAPSLHPALAGLIDRCVSLNMNARPRNAGELFHALRQIGPEIGYVSASSPLTALGTPVDPPQGEPKRGAIFAGGALAALLLVTLFWTLGPKRPEGAPVLLEGSAVSAAGETGALPNLAKTPAKTISAAPSPLPISEVPAQPFRYARARLPSPSVDNVSSQVEGGWISYRGGTLTQRWGRLLFDLLPEAARAEWASPGLRYQWGHLWRELPLEEVAGTLRVRTDDFTDFQARGQNTELLLDRPVRVAREGALVLGEGRCSLRIGDLVTAVSWQVRGYRKLNGRCEGSACVDRLARVIKQSQARRAKPRLRLTVERWDERRGLTREERLRCRL
ncbi:MAG: serine/threonine-protein kinase [Myxococcota bacterium]|nr:serine/threonine-protein kinase [Myxococcota bacterium]